MAACEDAQADHAQVTYFSDCVDHPQVTLIPAKPEVSAASIDADAPRALEVQGASLFIDPWCA